MAGLTRFSQKLARGHFHMGRTVQILEMKGLSPLSWAVGVICA